MKFSDIENMWSLDVGLLSNADKGRVYYERAKQVVRDAMADPAVFHRAIEGKRFRRDYLVEKVGCAASVPTQNPRVRELLVDTDRRIGESTNAKGRTFKPASANQKEDLLEIRTLVESLNKRVDEQDRLIAELRLKRHE